jgi:Ca2+-dependent lipid-binding protein
LCPSLIHLPIPQVLAASGLVKRDLFSLPNPFAVITTDGSDLRQTTVFKRTLTPYWNETFELFVPYLLFSSLPHSSSSQRRQRFFQNPNSSL